MAPQKQSRKEALQLGYLPSVIGTYPITKDGMDAAVVRTGTCPMHGSKFAVDVRASENALPKCTVQTGWQGGRRGRGRPCGLCRAEKLHRGYDAWLCCPHLHKALHVMPGACRACQCRAHAMSW
jgi:hypothetical protein